MWTSRSSEAPGKVLFAGVVEIEERGFGWARFGVMADDSTENLAAFLEFHVEA